MYRIMIVEDEPLIRKGIARMVERLSSDFYVVREACCAEEALQFLKEVRIDVVISDICMGDIDGTEMAGILAEKYTDIVTVLLSGYSDFSYAKKAIESKVFAYLLKPLDENQIHVLLDNIKKELDYRGQLRQKDYLIDLHVTGNVSYLFWMIKQKELTFYMESGQEEKVVDIAGELFGYMRENGLDVYVCKQLTLELLNLILNSSNILTEAEKQSLIAEFCNGANLDSIMDTPGLENWFVKKIMEIFGRFNSKKVCGSNHVVEEIQAYIEENYGLELSLTKVADLFGFNSFYLSNLFKSCTGSNFLEFVNQTRVRKAIELFKCGNMKIYEVAAMVGYQNVNNFSILFKKYTGITPGEYRKKLNENLSIRKEEK